jgi:hypothetical protein
MYGEEVGGRGGGTVHCECAVCIHPLAYWLGLKVQRVYHAIGEALDLDIGLHAEKLPTRT